MELRHLEYFLVVDEERSFTRAARRLHVVQSGVSSVIKALEHELGTQLFDRNTRHVELTEAGAAFAVKARAALDAVQDARDTIDELRGGLRGTVRIGVMTSVSVIDIPALLGRFHRQHPQVTLRLSAAPSGSQGLVTSLGEGSLDVAFVSIPGTPPPGITLLDLASAQLDLVVPGDHPLAGRHRVKLDELAGEEFVDFPIGYGNRTVTDRAFTAAGIDRTVTTEIADINAAEAFVRAGLGIALLPRFVLAAHPGSPRITVVGADLRWPMGIATSTSRRPSAASRALISMITDVIPRDERSA